MKCCEEAYNFSSSDCELLWSHRSERVHGLDRLRCSKLKEKVEKEKQEEEREEEGAEE